MTHKIVTGKAIRLACTLLLLVACGGGGPPLPETVSVTFEIQAIGGGATYNFGVVGGEGTIGSTGGPDVIQESFVARVGDQVIARATGFVRQGESTHEVICRILVRGEEIYVHGDQGTANDPSEVECAVLVYIPEKDDD